MQPETHATQNTHHGESRPQGGGTADEEGVVGARPASRREDRVGGLGSRGTREGGQTSGTRACPSHVESFYLSYDICHMHVI